MRKLICIAAIMITALAVCACSSSNSGTVSNPPTNSVASQSVTALSGTSSAVNSSLANYDLDTYTMDGTLSGGYSYTATLKVGPWVKASDMETVTAAWQAVGGKGTLPDINRFKPNKYATADHFFETGTSIYAFGTMVIEDTTEGGFKIADSTQPLTVRVLSPEIKQSHSIFDGLVQYGDNQFEYTHSVENYVDYLVDISPDMKGRNWGPVPFAVCIAEALSPEYPDGDPEIIDATWVFGNDRFTVSPVWTS